MIFMNATIYENTENIRFRFLDCKTSVFAKARRPLPVKGNKRKAAAMADAFMQS